MAVLDTRLLNEVYDQHKDGSVYRDIVTEVFRLRRVVGRILTGTRTMSEADRDLVKLIVEQEGVHTLDL